MISAPQRGLDERLARAEERALPWLAGFAVLLALQISPLWYATPDGAAYLSIARGIAAGGPLARLGDAQLGFPIGYPLLISPVFLAGARPFMLLALVHWLLAVVFMVGVYRWTRQYIGTGALWVTGLVMANVNVWNLYRRTLSEAAFLAVMIWTVNGLNRALTEPTARRAGALMPMLVAAAALPLLSAIREVGVLFGAGFVLALLARVPRRAMTWQAATLPLLVCIAVIPVAALVIRPERLAAAGPAFAGHLAGYADAGDAIGASLGARLHLRMTEIGQLLVPGMFKAYGSGWIDINTLIYAPLLAAVSYGWWKFLRRSGEVFAFTAPLYLGLHLAWPYAAGSRYLLPLVPLLFVCLWTACAPLRHTRRVLFAGLLVAHVGVAAGYWLAIDAPRARACDRDWPALEQLGARLRADARPILAAGVPGCVAPMLELVVDRPVQWSHDGAAVDAGVHWLLLPDHAAPVGGFAPGPGAAGGYRLLERDG